jgi:3-hydroxyisobutyrate dehydrogenase
MDKPFASVALIGFGEAGTIFTRDLRAAGIRDIRAYDIAFVDPRSPQSAAARAADVRLAAGPHAAIAGADLVISAVTAGSDLDAARSCVGGLAPASLFLDINSVAPTTKTEAARIVERAGARYVEAAVMAPVTPRGLKTPILLGGPHAGEFLRRASGWPLDAKAFSERIGAASSVKMCRSIVIKGLEALAIECAMTARHYGVLDDVIATFAETFPGQDWNARMRYFVSRALVHGRRRAEEMREVARTIEDAGQRPVMTGSTVVVQDWAADLGAIIGAARANGADFGGLLDDLDRASLQHAARRGGAMAAK